jgi:O-antigen/teichoic acid export membrane protein
VKFLVKYSVVALVSVFPISIASILFPTAIVKMFYAPEYASAIPVLQILGVYLGVYSTAMVPAQYVVACRREWHYLFNVLCGGIANVSLCFFLIPRYTAVGASLALLISHSLTMCLNYATAAIITIRGER